MDLVSISPAPSSVKGILWPSSGLHVHTGTRHIQREYKLPFQVTTHHPVYISTQKILEVCSAPRACWCMCAALRSHEIERALLISGSNQCLYTEPFHLDQPLMGKESLNEEKHNC